MIFHPGKDSLQHSICKICTAPKPVLTQMPGLSNEFVAFFKKLFDTSDWPARWHCGSWTDFHGWLYIVSDLGIWAAYFAIPFLLLRLITRRKDIPFLKIFWLFIAFILLCGLTHLIDAVMFWWPVYRVSALMRFFTAVVSVSTVVVLNKNLPVLLSLKTAKELEDEIELRKKAEVRSHNQYQEVERILEASLDIICTINKKKEFVRISKAAETILGYSISELTGRKYTDFLYPEETKQTIENRKRVFSGIPMQNLENRYRRKDGSLVYLSWKSSLSEDQETLFAIGRDITDQKYQEQALEKLNDALVEKVIKLKEQDKAIEIIRDTISQIVWTANSDGNIDYYNQHWYDYTGLSFEQAKGWGWSPVLHPDDLQHTIDAWTEAYTTGTSYSVEFRLRRASDGTYRWHAGKAEPMKNAEGKIIKWFGSSTDIDEYKRALDLEKKLSQIEDFNKMVAHNLRGPAGNIDAILDLLHQSTSEEDKMTLLSMLKQSSSGLNHTLQELMKVLEFRLNKSIPFECCKLEEIINITKDMLKKEIFFKNATIITQFNVADISYPKAYLESLFYNMISNALKYCKCATKPVIEVKSELIDNHVILTFKDNGLGIDLKKHGNDMFKLNKVFHAGYDSKGIGLFMTKSQVETFGGSISVESEPDRGTVFKVTLQ